MDKNSIYASYLVRIWREPGNWRSEVESIQTGRKWEFTNLERMFDFLQALGEPAEESDQENG